MKVHTILDPLTPDTNNSIVELNARLVRIQSLVVTTSASITDYILRQSMALRKIEVKYPYANNIHALPPINDYGGSGYQLVNDLGVREDIVQYMDDPLIRKTIKLFHKLREAEIMLSNLAMARTLVTKAIATNQPV